MSDAWAEYCAAARRLDAVRRGAATAVGEQAQAVRAARDELGAVRARLIPQQARLRESGVPETDLRPTSTETVAADEATSGGPAHVLAALRQARSTADRADAALIGAPVPSATPAPGSRRGLGQALTPALGGIARAAGGRAWLRNLLVYGPFGAAVLAVQVALLLTAGGTPMTIYSLGCGLSLPLFALALGWVTIGLVFPAPAGERPDRTLKVGAAVCFAPILVTLIGSAVLAFTS